MIKIDLGFLVAMKTDLGRLLKMHTFGEYLYAGRQTSYSYIKSTV